ncbi:MAG: acyl-CoA dehydrogenase [Bradyrhizobiaceae bacterium]|nr:MAG: acyl-CoA dehydrogenase [Bradyrhizobiaceae bacterium]
MRFSFPTADPMDGLTALRREVGEFLSEARSAGAFTPRCSGWMAFDADFSRSCGERGYIGMTWPRRYGGQERSAIERYVVVEEMLAAGAPVGAHWIADRQSGPQILNNGSEELKRELLPRIARGEVFFAIGMSEPDAGSDLSNIRSRARKTEGGWRLDGRKIWMTNGHRAHYLIGLFRTGPAEAGSRHAGMTQFIVDLSAPGIERRPIEDMIGEKDFTEVVLDEVFVPDHYVLGMPGDGWRLVMAELAYERSGPERFLSVFPLLNEAVDLLRGSATEVERRGIGRIVAHLATLREMSISIAARLARGELPSTEAALVKDLGNALEREIPEVLRGFARQPPRHGGDDYSQRLGDAILAAPSFTLRGGTPEILRGIIARELGLR